MSTRSTSRTRMSPRSRERRRRLRAPKLWCGGFAYDPGSDCAAADDTSIFLTSFSSCSLAMHPCFDFRDSAAFPSHKGYRKSHLMSVSNRTRRQPGPRTTCARISRSRALSLSRPGGPRVPHGVELIVLVAAATDLPCTNRLFAFRAEFGPKGRRSTRQTAWLWQPLAFTRLWIPVQGLSCRCPGRARRICGSTYNTPSIGLTHSSPR